MGWRDRLQTLQAEELAQTAQLAVGHIPQIASDEAGRMKREALAGMMRAALQRPPSWSDAAAVPWPGCWCSCCRLGRWWTEVREPRGWRCWTCHPPDGVTFGAVREVRT